MFFHDKDIEWDVPGEGLHRKLLTFEDKMMMTKIRFKAGAVGAAHSNSNIQCSYVESSEFVLAIDERSETLVAGDGFLVSSDNFHDVFTVC